MAHTVPSPQAVEIPNSKVVGRSAIYRNVLSVDSLTKFHIPNPINTGFEAFETGHKLYPNRRCLGHREWNPVTAKWSPYIWETYDEVKQRRDNFGSGLVHLYHNVLKGKKATQFCIGVLSINRVEWVLTDLACQAQSLVTVALYDTLGPDATEYIINLTDIEILVASIENIPKLLIIREKIPCLKAIICMDSLSAQNEGVVVQAGKSKMDILKAWGNHKGVLITDFQTVEHTGKSSPCPNIVPKPSDIFTINFTSGTTGMPKGVVLTQGNATAPVIGPLTLLLPHEKGEEVVLSFLPMAHIYERGNMISSLFRGAAIGMYHGVITEILDDIQALQPTTLMAVPRLLLRIEAAIRNSTINAPGLRGALSRKALADKLAKMDAGGGQYHWLWDRVWSRNIRKVLGGNINLIISGSAPLSKDSTRFLRAALACDVIEGYGMTETMACGTVSHVKDPVVGHVGPPIPHCEITLLDVPEMNYTSNDKPFPRGELLLRGVNRFQEYYKEKEKTGEAIDKEGWLHTGDVAMIDNEGRVSIIDRVKNIFKLSQGEYVAAERLEALYSSSQLVAQIFIHGDSQESYLVAVIGVDPATFPAFASNVLQRDVKTLIDRAAISAACNDSRVRSAFVRELDKVARLKDLQGFERVKNIYLAVEPFTIENGTLTPSFKLKRNIALQLFRKELDLLYAETGRGVRPLAKL